MLLLEPAFTLTICDVVECYPVLCDGFIEHTHHLAARDEHTVERASVDVQAQLSRPSPISTAHNLGEFDLL